MNCEVVFTSEACKVASEHLLQHFQRDRDQEDLCFALWRKSTGTNRITALIDEVILPVNNERILHGNASFSPDYLSRVLKSASKKNTGIVFMHSHPSEGWQGMSETDVIAEKQVLAYPAMSTGLPLVGMTVGNDGYWSARFWERKDTKMHRQWCEKVRIVHSRSYKIHYNDNVSPPPSRKRILERTFDTWGSETQNTIARLHVGIVGLGSVGCIVAEAITRLGITRVTVIDPDEVKEHNLDRLLYGSENDIGKQKVDLASRSMQSHSTADGIEIIKMPISIHEETAYKAALDCDLIFSCVDRPVARDVLNHIANAHLIPVIDGGVYVETNPTKGNFSSAHWRTHLVTPYHQCLRCNGQYNTSDVKLELDGLLDEPSYIDGLRQEQRPRNQNVFPFSLSVAGMEINLMIRYLIAHNWWPQVRQQEYQFVTAKTRTINKECHENCAIRTKLAKGDMANPAYLSRSRPHTWWRSLWRSIAKMTR